MAERAQDVRPAPGAARRVAWALGLALALVLLLAWPAHAWAGREGLLALGLAGGIGFLGALAGHLAAAGLGRLVPGPQGSVQALQAGMAVRVLVTLLCAAPVYFLDAAPDLPFTVFLALGYLAQLVLEVFVSVRIVGQNPGPSAAEGAGAEEARAAEGAASGSQPAARPKPRD